MKEIQLITTDYSSKILKKKKLFYLGAWCSINNSQKKLLKYIWHVERNLKKDYTYLDNLFKKLIKIIPNYLNSYHKTNFPLIFWQSLIWVWLAYYLSSSFLRWQTFKSAIKKNQKNKIKFVQFQFIGSLCPRDTLSYKNYIQESDSYNEYVFSKISNFFSNNLIITKKDFKDYNFNHKFHFNLKEKILRFLKKFSNFLTINIFKNRSIILQGFKFKNLIYLCFKNLRFPIFISEIFSTDGTQLKTLSKDEINKRKGKNFKFKTENNYEKYLEENLYLEIPTYFVEDFQKIKLKSENLKIKTNLIISSVEHYFNDKFKIWIFLKKIFKKNKFVIIEHGGNHSQSRHSALFDYDRKVSDIFIPWDKSAKLPVEKYIGNDFSKNKLKKLLYVGHEIERFPSKIVPDVNSLTDLESLSNLSYLKNKLKKNILNELIYCEKLYSENRISDSISSILGKEKVLKRGSFMNVLKKTKLAISDSAQTSYFDCITICPTILVLDFKKNWRPLPKYFPLYNLLQKNNMLFKDIDKATKFINKNWLQIDEWWNSNKIKIVREKLFNEFNINLEPQGIKKWNEFISKNINH